MALQHTFQSSPDTSLQPTLKTPNGRILDREWTLSAGARRRRARDRYRALRLRACRPLARLFAVPRASPRAAVRARSRRPDCAARRPQTSWSRRPQTRRPLPRDPPRLACKFLSFLSVFFSRTFSLCASVCAVFKSSKIHTFKLSKVCVERASLSPPRAPLRGLCCEARRDSSRNETPSEHRLGARVRGGVRPRARAGTGLSPTAADPRANLPRTLSRRHHGGDVSY